MPGSASLSNHGTCMAPVREMAREGGGKTVANLQKVLEVQGGRPRETSTG